MYITVIQFKNDFLLMYLPTFSFLEKLIMKTAYRVSIEDPGHEEPYFHQNVF